MAIVRLPAEELNRPLSAKQRRRLEELAALPDEAIDTTDIPEVSEEQRLNGIQFRPGLSRVSTKVDPEIIRWLMSKGPAAVRLVNEASREAREADRDR